MTEINIKEGFMYGAWRAPENLWSDLKTSIHDDATARKVGMRGGTIPGIIHLSMFAPLLLKIFGQRWFEKGSLSMYYTFATIHKEKVRAIVKVPPEEFNDVQVETRVDMPDGQVVATGTAAVGEPKELSYIQSIELKNSKPEDLRILAGIKVGDDLNSKDVLISQEDANEGLRAITDHLDYYKGNSPWGKPILSPSAIFWTLSLNSKKLDTARARGVPFYGATEIRIINGPVMVDIPYEATGKIISVGVTRKTEYYWYDSILKEKESGKVVASLRQMNRSMKAGSPVYSEDV